MAEGKSGPEQRAVLRGTVGAVSVGAVGTVHRADLRRSYRMGYDRKRQARLRLSHEFRPHRTRCRSVRDRTVFRIERHTRDTTRSERFRGRSHPDRRSGLRFVGWNLHCGRFDRAEHGESLWSGVVHRDEQPVGVLALGDLRRFESNQCRGLLRGHVAHGRSRMGWAHRITSRLGLWQLCCRSVGFAVPHAPDCSEMQRLHKLQRGQYGSVAQYHGGRVSGSDHDREGGRRRDE